MLPLSKATAYRIEAMERAGLINYKHHVPWADEIISQFDKPPYWVIQLSTLKYVGDVQKALHEYLASEPFENLDGDQYDRYYLASLILRYRRRELSWASFLDAAGRYTDGSGGNHPCEYFFEMLNNFEDSNFDPALEEMQKKQIFAEYESAVQELLPYYEEFLRFYSK